MIPAPSTQNTRLQSCVHFTSGAANSRYKQRASLVVVNTQKSKHSDRNSAHSTISQCRRRATLGALQIFRDLYIFRWSKINNDPPQTNLDPSSTASTFWSIQLLPGGEGNRTILKVNIAQFIEFVWKKIYCEIPSSEFCS